MGLHRSEVNGRATVLFVDDEAALRSLAFEELRDAGFDVVCAADGVEALDKLEEHPEVSILITDVRMPRMGGRELLMNAKARQPLLKAALVTAYMDDAVRFMDMIEVPILLKPFNLERLSDLALKMASAH